MAIIGSLRLSTAYDRWNSLRHPISPPISFILFQMHRWLASRIVHDEVAEEPGQLCLLVICLYIVHANSTITEV